MWWARQPTSARRETRVIRLRSNSNHYSAWVASKVRQRAAGEQATRRSPGWPRRVIQGKMESQAARWQASSAQRCRPLAPGVSTSWARGACSLWTSGRWRAPPILPIRGPGLESFRHERRLQRLQEPMTRQAIMDLCPKLRRRLAQCTSLLCSMDSRPGRSLTPGSLMGTLRASKRMPAPSLEVLRQDMTVAEVLALRQPALARFAAPARPASTAASADSARPSSTSSQASTTHAATSAKASKPATQPVPSDRGSPQHQRA